MDIRKHRKEVQDIVREEAEQSGGDAKVARRRIRERLRARFGGQPGINPIIMSLLLQLAMALFMEWWNSRKDKPERVALSLDDLDDDDDFEGLAEASELC